MFHSGFGRPAFSLIDTVFWSMSLYWDKANRESGAVVPPEHPFASWVFSSRRGTPLSKLVFDTTLFTPGSSSRRSSSSRPNSGLPGGYRPSRTLWGVALETCLLVTPWPNETNSIPVWVLKRRKALKSTHHLLLEYHVHLIKSLSEPKTHGHSNTVTSYERGCTWILYSMLRHHLRLCNNIWCRIS